MVVLQLLEDRDKYELGWRSAIGLADDEPVFFGCPDKFSELGALASSVLDFPNGRMTGVKSVSHDGGDDQLPNGIRVTAGSYAFGLSLDELCTKVVSPSHRVTNLVLF
ncbi:hypothetical protein L3X38_041310 [Prunus dulcis]|uniref:Uncharacterized protein n=1 Tax=Prunus dulcis TaxID=3755 RepID=A0AAD4UUP8_PRUDU|nr:hypothetical protein L3X38_041310 [Prunus dulcis]